MEALLQVTRALITVLTEIAPDSKEKLSIINDQVVGIEKRLEGDNEDARVVQEGKAQQTTFQTCVFLHGFHESIVRFFVHVLGYNRSLHSCFEERILVGVSSHIPPIIGVQRRSRRHCKSGMRELQETYH